jgi:hypothetical protein
MSIKEENFKKFAKTSIPMRFVKAHDGEWDHTAWEAFCEKITKAAKYTPIDFDQVGLLLEKKKAEYLKKK